MKQIFDQYHIELSEEETAKFEKFLEIFMQTNAQINLSAIREPDAIVEKHFVDSLMLAALYDIEGKVMDLWTWGWFPGIPLAIVTPEADFTLIDSVAKKLKCVEGFVDELELVNVDTLVWRAEEIGQDPEHRESFDLAVSRATAYFPTLLEYVLPLLKVGGVFAAYKLTDKDELTSTKKALKRLWGKIMKVKNYDLAGQERSIIFIEKIAPTHKKYPRKAWIPLKDPIV